MEFTKANVQDAIDAANEIMEGMKKKAIDYMGHFNHIFLVLEAAKKAAPEK